MEPIILAYGLFAIMILAGIVIYERTGWRLGGVLVAPLLAIYTVADPWLLVVFAGAAIVSLLGAGLARRRWFLYGRRIMAFHILLGLGASLALLHLLPVHYSGIALPVLPGIFAYNVHREEGLAAPVVRFGAVVALFLGLLLAAAPPGLGHDPTRLVALHGREVAGLAALGMSLGVETTVGVDLE